MIIRERESQFKVKSISPTIETQMRNQERMIAAKLRKLPRGTKIFCECLCETGETDTFCCRLISRHSVEFV